MDNRSIYEGTERTAPADYAKVKKTVGSKYTLETPDGRVIHNVGGFGRYKYAVGMCVTYNRKGGNYQILQIAPASF